MVDPPSGRPGPYFPPLAPCSILGFNPESPTTAFPIPHQTPREAWFTLQSAFLPVTPFTLLRSSPPHRSLDPPAPGPLPAPGTAWTALGKLPLTFLLPILGEIDPTPITQGITPHFSRSFCLRPSTFALRNNYSSHIPFPGSRIPQSSSY